MLSDQKSNAYTLSMALLNIRAIIASAVVPDSTFILPKSVSESVPRSFHFKSMTTHIKFHAASRS